MLDRFITESATLSERLKSKGILLINSFRWCYLIRKWNIYKEFPKDKVFKSLLNWYTEVKKLYVFYKFFVGGLTII